MGNRAALCVVALACFIGCTGGGAPLESRFRAVPQCSEEARLVLSAVARARASGMWGRLPVGTLDVLKEAHDACASEAFRESIELLILIKDSTDDVKVLHPESDPLPMLLFLAAAHPLTGLREAAIFGLLERGRPAGFEAVLRMAATEPPGNLRTRMIKVLSRRLRGEPHLLWDEGVRAAIADLFRLGNDAELSILSFALVGYEDLIRPWIDRTTLQGDFFPVGLLSRVADRRAEVIGFLRSHPEYLEEVVEAWERTGDPFPDDLAMLLKEDLGDSAWSNLRLWGLLKRSSDGMVRSALVEWEDRWRRAGSARERILLAYELSEATHERITETLLRVAGADPEPMVRLEAAGALLGRPGALLDEALIERMRPLVEPWLREGALSSTSIRAVRFASIAMEAFPGAPERYLRIIRNCLFAFARAEDLEAVASIPERLDFPFLLTLSGQAEVLRQVVREGIVNEAVDYIRFR